MKKCIEKTFVLAWVTLAGTSALATEYKIACNSSAYAYTQNYDKDFTTEDNFYNTTQGDLFFFNDQNDFSNIETRNLYHQQVLDHKHLIAFTYDATVVVFKNKPYIVMTTLINDYSDNEKSQESFAKEYFDLEAGVYNGVVHFNTSNPLEPSKSFIRASFFGCQKL